MIDFLERLLAAQRRAEDGEKEPLLLLADPAWAAPAEEEKTGGAGRPEAGGETEEGAQAAERCGVWEEFGAAGRKDAPYGRRAAAAPASGGGEGQAGAAARGREEGASAPKTSAGAARPRETAAGRSPDAGAWLEEQVRRSAAAAGSIGTGPGRIAVVERQTEESAAGVTAAELDRVLERDARRYDAGFRLF